MQDLEDAILGSSSAMAELRTYLPKVARSSSTVLITGDTGTGKERVANLLHQLGPRRSHPFIALNCAALPDSLAESELFGYERGAFTGAVAATPGHFVRAQGGTLFLDEIGEMSLYAQAKLLRVLETREVLPVGGRRPQPVDVRIVAATNQPLEVLVKNGQFRQDLFYRLNVARLVLPPIRERREDIPILFCQAVEDLNLRNNRSVGAPTPELLGCLMAHDWPGNVRELRNLVEAIFIDPPQAQIGLEHLPPAFRQLFSGYRSHQLDERERMLQILEQTQWNKAKAAKQLNWSRMTLYRKLAHYQVGSSR